jgi:hypothetical protein
VVVWASEKPVIPRRARSPTNYCPEGLSLAEGDADGDGEASDLLPVSELELFFVEDDFFDGEGEVSALAELFFVVLDAVVPDFLPVEDVVVDFFPVVPVAVCVVVEVFVLAALSLLLLAQETMNAAAAMTVIKDRTFFIGVVVG